jgi:hypothetical protein
MSAVRIKSVFPVAIFLALAGETMPVLAEPVTCESHQDRVDAYGEASYRGDESRRDEPRSDPRYINSQYERADNIRERARDACIEAAPSQAFGASTAHWLGQGSLWVTLDTPTGPLICTVGRDGSVRSIDRR